MPDTLCKDDFIDDVVIVEEQIKPVEPNIGENFTLAKEETEMIYEEEKEQSPLYHKPFELDFLPGRIALQPLSNNIIN